MIGNKKTVKLKKAKKKVKWKIVAGKKKYTLTTANDNEQYKGRNPKSWILYGSKDGNN